MNLLLNAKRELRNIWWVAIFFLVLASITLPVILLSQHYKMEITMTHQAIIVIVATWICQLMRRKPFIELTGALNAIWMKKLFSGFLIGAALMLIPASILYLFGWINWKINPLDFNALLSVTLMFAGVALAEEFLFRGFIFQRLMDSIGIWQAQFLIAAYFLLTHINNPGMTGSIKVLAGINIFLASILFGLAFIKTKSLSMPIGLHFMANWVQGSLLGFGVSGTEQSGIFQPVFKDTPVWLTGGSFGLEASVPGLITVVITIILFYRWKPAYRSSSEINPLKTWHRRLNLCLSRLIDTEPPN